MDRVERVWSYVALNYTPEAIEFWGSLFVQGTVFWTLSMIFVMMDLRGPSVIRHYKIQPSWRQPSPQVLWECIIGTIQNQAMAAALHFLQLFTLRPLIPLISTLRSEPQLPTITQHLTDIVLCSLIREILFYYGHRILHWPLFYRHFHKQHHRLTTSIALATQYCHPVEHIVTNIIPLILPAKLLRVHIVTFWLFVTGALAQASLAHSGYDFFRILWWRSKVHDLHHERSSVNYGIIGLMDYLHGTRDCGDGEVRRQPQEKKAKTSE